MAKGKDNIDVNKNFEILKAQMKKKRELAESLAEETEGNGVQNEDKNTTENKNVNNETNNNTYTADDVDNYTDVDEDVTGGIEYTAKKTGVVSDININKIVIKKIDKPELPKRITYYLRPDTIKKIDRFSRQAGMGKSEFVQTILDEILNNLEIEK